MTFKTIILVVFVAIAFYSAQTNASSIDASECTLGLFPFGTTMNEDTKKDEVVLAFEKKGYLVSVLTNPSEVKNAEFISDASVECTSTYFGIMAKTSVRLVETLSNLTIAKATSPAVMELFSCKIDLFTAIAELPSCQIK